MKKLLSIIILGLFFVVLGCEKDEAIQSEVSDIDGVEVVGTVQPGQDVGGDLGPVEGVQHRVINTRAANGEGCDFTLDPDYFEVSLFPGQSATEIKKACVEIPPIADILFSFDLTGSMEGELIEVKKDCENIGDAIRNAVSDCQSGVVSHMDYLLEDYTTCGYTGSYGYGSDYPYKLDQALTDNNILVKNAVNALSLGSGWDHPESYSRVFYETYTDASIGWRPEAAKYVVAFLDAIPHDCVITSYPYDGASPMTISRGEDPVVAAAGLDFYGVLDGMEAAGINLVVVYSGTSYFDWTWWKSLESSHAVKAYRINSDGTVPGDMNIADFIIEAIKGSVPDVGELYLVPEPAEYASWVTIDPLKHYGVAPGTTVEFEVTYTVPMGTPAGAYDFELQLWGDDFYYASQEVKIEWIDVPLDIKPTSCPNPLNRKSGGVMPAAILGGPDFDVTTIDPESILLEGIAPVRVDYEDVSAPYFPFIGKRDGYDCNEDGPDGFMDMTMKFASRDIAELYPDAERGDVLILKLTGMTYDGILIRGEDVMIVVK